MAFLERLQIIIDADSKGAVREFKQIGNTADRELAKTRKGLDGLANSLTSFGTGSLIAGAALGAGLAMFAKEASDAATQQLKLTTSIKNSDNVFANSGKALRDQASALMGVTAADDDAIASAQGLLVQFGRTESEILGLTPLVVDLSRRMGIDLDSAAKAVGKASDGSAGALKKMGIEVTDLGGNATDTENVIAALTGTVGGFAESEGKTFAGQLEIMKNKFGELKESVGTGVLDVVNPLLNIGGALGEVNPQIGETVGKLATIGAVGAGLVGSLSVGAGAIIKMRDSFTTLSGTGADATRSLTNVGKAAAVVGGAATVYAIYQIAKALNQASVDAAAVAFEISSIELELSKTGKVSAESFGKLANESQGAIDKLSDLGDATLDVFNLSKTSGTFSLNGVVVQFDNATNALKKLQSAGKQKELEETLALLEGADFGKGGGVEAEKQRKKFLDYIKNLEGTLDNEAEAAKGAELATADFTGELEEQSEEMKMLAGTAKIYEAQLGFIAATQQLGADRAAAFNRSIEDSTLLDDQAVAAFGMNGAYKGLFDTLNDLPKEFDIVKSALGDYTDEQNKAVDAVIKFGDTAGGVLEQAIKAGEDPAFLGAILRSRLEEVLKNAGIPPEQVGEYLQLAGLTEQQINVAIKLSIDEEERQKFLNLLQLFEATGQEFSPEITPKINELFIAGEFAKLNALIAASQPGVTKTQLDFVLGIYPDLAPALADAQAQADAAPPVITPQVQPFGTMLSFLIGDAQLAANANPINVPVKLSPFAGASASGTANTYFPSGINPNDLPVQQEELDTGLDLNFNGIIGRAKGGPVNAGTTYQVNEKGRELFTPSSNGFIMNASDAAALLQGVSQLVSSGGGGGMVNNITITETSSPRQTALEVIRANKASLFLAGAL